MAVNYGAGASSAIASQYESLRRALADKGAAENLREARNIERKGLFGTGIKTSDIKDLTSAGLSVAEFGQTRMEGQMDRAEKSFGRRQKADERRLATLQSRADKNMLGAKGKEEMRGIQFGMKERRDSFEDTLSKYRDKGLWGSGFGSEGVGYRTEGESKYSQSMGPKGPVPEGPRPGEFNDVRDLGDFERSASQPDIDQKLSGERKIKENAPIGPEGLNARMKREYLEREKRRGQAADMKKRLDFGGISDRISSIPAGERATQQTRFGRSEWEDKHGRGTFDPTKGMMNIEPLDFSRDRISDSEREKVRDMGYIG